MTDPAPPLRLAVPDGPAARGRAEAIAQSLRSSHMAAGARAYAALPDLEIQVVPGDVAAARLAVAEGRAEVAVLPFDTLPLTPAGADATAALRLAAVPPRDDPREALVARDGKAFTYLAPGTVFGVASTRRRGQLIRRRSDLEPRDAPAELSARLRMLDAGEVEAIFAGAAELRHAGLTDRITEPIDTRQMLPAAGQGAVALEIRPEDAASAALLAPLHDAPAEFAVRAERACLARLGGEGRGRAAIAVYAVTDGEQMFIHGFVGTADGQEAARLRWQGPMREAAEVGATLAELLLAAGADRLLPGIALPPHMDLQPREDA